MRHLKRITMTSPSNDNDPREPWLTYGCGAFVASIFIIIAGLVRNVVVGGSFSVSILIGAGLATILLALALLGVSSTENR